MREVLRLELVLERSRREQSRRVMSGQLPGWGGRGCSSPPAALGQPGDGDRDGELVRRGRTHSQGAPSQAVGTTMSLPPCDRSYWDRRGTLPIPIPPYHCGLEETTAVWGQW